MWLSKLRTRVGETVDHLMGEEGPICDPRQSVLEKLTLLLLFGIFCILVALSIVGKPEVQQATEQQQQSKLASALEALATLEDELSETRQENAVTKGKLGAFTARLETIQSQLAAVERQLSDLTAASNRLMGKVAQNAEGLKQLTADLEQANRETVKRSDLPPLGEVARERDEAMDRAAKAEDAVRDFIDAMEASEIYP
jgi:chromosome segregation ATPase